MADLISNSDLLAEALAALDTKSAGGVDTSDLQATVTNLQSVVSNLQAAVTNLQNRVAALEEAIGCSL